jgi:hypothetical protein
MRRLRKTCLVTMLLVSSSFQFDRFIAARSPQAPQDSRPVATAPGTVPQSPQALQQRQDTSGAKAQAGEKKQPDYSQEAYVIERIWRTLVRPTVPGIDHFSRLCKYAICGKKRTEGWWLA